MTQIIMQILIQMMLATVETVEMMETVEIMETVEMNEDAGDDGIDREDDDVAGLNADNDSLILF